MHKNGIERSQIKLMPNNPTKGLGSSVEAEIAVFGLEGLLLG